MLSRSIRAAAIAATLTTLSPPIAAAQDIAVTLSPALIAEISRLVDLQPLDKSAPPTFWELQTKLNEALQANPDAFRAVLQERSARR
jgi:hypothetical protein